MSVSEACVGEDPAANVVGISLCMTGAWSVSVRPDSLVGGRKGWSELTALSDGCLTGEILTGWNVGWSDDFSLDSI